MNLNDFDSKYGHRRNVRGYADALERLDGMIPAILERIRPGDGLIFTADHGCDPTAPGAITRASTCRSWNMGLRRCRHRRGGRDEPGRRADGCDFGFPEKVSALETRFGPPAPSAVGTLAARRTPAWYGPAKRAIDVTVASVGLLVTLPITLAAMAGIVLVTGEGPLYRQERVGVNGASSRCTSSAAW